MRYGATIIAAAALAVALTACLHTADDHAPTADTLADMAAATDTAAMVMRVRQTSRLYTAEYHVHKVVTHRDVRRLRGHILGRRFDTPLSLGDRKVAIPIDVWLQAYIDFSAFSANDIELSADGTTLHVWLPDPKVVVVSSKVDHAGTRQYADLLRTSYTDEEMAAFTRQGLQAVVRAIPQMGIIETARESAAATLLPLFASLGYDEERVVVTFRQDHYTERDLPRLYDSEATRRHLGNATTQPSRQ